MASPAIDLTVHRFDRGQRAKLGDRRLAYEHPFARVDDEESFELETPDGGNASVVRAGPGGAYSDTDFAEIDVRRLTSEIAEFVRAYAIKGGFAIATWAETWPRAQYVVYEWERTPDDFEWAASQGIEVTVRSIPTAVVLVPGVNDETPAEWPRPISTPTPGGLLIELSRRST